MKSTPPPRLSSDDDDEEKSESPYNISLSTRVKARPDFSQFEVRDRRPEGDLERPHEEISLSLPHNLSLSCSERLLEPRLLPPPSLPLDPVPTCREFNAPFHSSPHPPEESTSQLPTPHSRVVLIQNRVRLSGSPLFYPLRMIKHSFRFRYPYYRLGELNSQCGRGEDA